MAHGFWLGSTGLWKRHLWKRLKLWKGTVLEITGQQKEEAFSGKTEGGDCPQMWYLGSLLGSGLST